MFVGFDESLVKSLGGLSFHLGSATGKEQASPPARVLMDIYSCVTHLLRAYGIPVWEWGWVLGINW